MVCLLKMVRDLLFADLAHFDEGPTLQSLHIRWKIPYLLCGCKKTNGINNNNNNKNEYD
jgi:hypothetical protein